MNTGTSVGELNISTLVSTAFLAARGKYQDLNKSWITASIRIGGRLPQSLLSASVQRDGEIDVVLRCMEDEQLGRQKMGIEDQLFFFHHQKIISELWIGSVYETTRLLIERKLAPSSAEFKRLAHEFRLLRIPIEKHQLAGDDQLTEPIIMQKMPPHGDETDYYTYPSGRDPTRAHIMPAGVSERGSVMWHVIDLPNKQSFWLERRKLAEQFLSLWQ